MRRGEDEGQVTQGEGSGQIAGEGGPREGRAEDRCGEGARSKDRSRTIVGDGVAFGVAFTGAPATARAATTTATP